MAFPPAPSGDYPVHPDQRASGSKRGAHGMLRPAAEAPEIRGAPLAPPRADRGGGGAALREPPHRGRVEVKGTEAVGGDGGAGGRARFTFLSSHDQV